MPRQFVHLLVVIAAVLSLDAWSLPRAAQRDATPAVAASGTGEIRGVVVSDEVRPQPIRRAIVTISGGGLGSARSVLTEDDGSFVFGRLPAGRFSVRVKKAAYLPAVYGAMKPGRDGSEISLADAQRASITIRMSKGAVIAGILRDESGQPLGGVTIWAIDARTSDSFNNLTNASNTKSDDRGAFRLFGLMPGEYVIAAVPTLTSSGQMGMRSTPEMDALLSDLAQRHPGGAAAPPPGPTSPLIPPSPPAGLAPVYYPGGAVAIDAVHIQVGAGEERSGIDFAIGLVPVANLSGTVSGDVPNLASVQLSIVFAGPRLNTSPGVSGITGQPPDAEGKFKFGSVPPGPLRIIARARRGATDSPSANQPFVAGGVSLASGGGSSAPRPGTPATPAEMLYGVADLDVRGQDLNGIMIPLQPGATLSGRIVFDVDRASPPADVAGISVTVSQPNGSFTSSSGGVTLGSGIMSVPSVRVREDRTFDVISIGPAQYRLGCQMPPELASTWRLRSAMANGVDLLDAPLELAPGTVLRDVVLTLSDKRTEINGTLQTPTGQVAASYFVIALPADRALWTSGARRIKSARPATDGRFLFSDLPAGKYLLAALTDLDPADLLSPAFLEQVAPAGVPVTIGEGETRTQDLKILTRPEEREGTKHRARRTKH